MSKLGIGASGNGRLVRIVLASMLLSVSCGILAGSGLTVALNRILATLKA